MELSTSAKLRKTTSPLKQPVTFNKFISCSPHFRKKYCTTKIEFDRSYEHIAGRFKWFQ